jgi:LAS superfamily LD-carboxypeptidase LdcB
MNIEILLGKTKEHLVPLEGTKFLIHRLMLKDLLRLQKDAHEAGHELEVISAFRDLERQREIWNAKARGERILLDDQGKPLDFRTLSPRQVMYAILRWSAIPGCSRHHWGTDIDVYDAKTQRAQEVRLLPAECEGDGPAAALHHWLDQRMESGEAHGFYRPYRNDLGGTAPERWHLSYAPLSLPMMEHFTFTLFMQHLNECDLMLKPELLAEANEIYQRFIINVDLP